MSSVIKVDAIQNQSGTSSLNVNSDGVIRHGKIPMLKVGLSTATTINSGDRILFNSFSSSHVFDGEDNMGAFNTSNNNYIIPANCGGLWHISASCYTTTSNINQLAVFVGGNRKDAIGSQGGASSMAQGSIIKRLSVGDVITMQGFSAGSTFTPQPNAYHSWWQMSFLG
tara:strand:- start:327 stop:833 length:507 start_codon:yes stop_codon:yes gene_type:complete